MEESAEAERKEILERAHSIVQKALNSICESCYNVEEAVGAVSSNQKNGDRRNKVGEANGTVPTEGGILGIPEIVQPNLDQGK